MNRRALKNAHAEAMLFRRRAAIGFVLVLLGIAFLAAWYFRLQVVEHDEYATRSEANRIRMVPAPPARGLIYDRKGRLLAENVPAWRLDVTPERAGDPQELLQRITPLVALDEEERADFLATFKAVRPYKAVTLKARVSEEEAALFAVDQWRFPGVELVPYLGREYPHKALLAHVVGYVGRVDKRDEQRMGQAIAAYRHTGKTGLERYYEDLLRGKPGYRRLETNVDGRTMRALDTLPATPGADLRLSLDLDLQQAMVWAFGDLQGSAVAIDPRTGGILAMVSLPDYDPNLFVNGIGHADYRRLNEDPGRPQFNRVVLGGVAPGSTIKPFVALAGLDSGKRTPEDRVLSTGMFRIAGQRRGYGDASRRGHGWTDLRKSIYASVNTYYYRLGLDMGIETFDRYMERYGFGQPTGVDLSGEIAGILPSPQWKQANAPKQGPWYPGDTVISSIGQGFWKVTPLQLAQATAALGDRGNLRRPHLVESVRSGYRAPWVEVAQPQPRSISDSPANLLAVHEGMVQTVHGPGTATNIRRGLTYTIAAKTGTAQVVSRRGSAAVNPRSLPMHLRHRALFIGYAPAEAPTIAVAVAVEGGGYGASTAAPIARKILDAWLLGKMPEPPQPSNAIPLPAPDFGNVVAGASALPAASAGAPRAAP